MFTNKEKFAIIVNSGPVVFLKDANTPMLDEFKRRSAEQGKCNNPRHRDAKVRCACASCMMDSSVDLFNSDSYLVSHPENKYKKVSV